MVKDLKEKIRIAADNNVIAYDCDAPPGRFTKRLVAIMKSFFVNNYKKEINTIYVCPSFLPEAHVENAIMDLFYSPNPCMNIFGVDIKIMSECPMQYYLDELQCSVASCDIAIVLAEDKDADKFLLGSY